MLNFWEGHKTQIVTVVGILLTIAYGMGWITFELYTALGLSIGFTGLSTVRHGMKTEAAKVMAKVENVGVQVARVPGVVAQVVAPAVVQAASLVAQETVAASVPPMIQLTNLSPERK